jgi:hypothetical protein
MKVLFRLIVILSSVFCLTAFSCSKKKTIGEPYILYEIHGTVYGTYYVDDTSTPEEGDKKRVTSPLKGIRVVSDSSSEPAYTSNEGRFVVYGRSVPADVVTIAFEDQDGEGNHGTFMRKTQRNELRQKSAGGDRNYEGYWIATDVEVNMFLKNDNLESDPDFNFSAN